MARPEMDGPNSGYAALLLEQYLDNPGSVPEEWRDLFESDPSAVLATQPGLARLLELAVGNGHSAPAPAAAAPAPAPVPPPPPTRSCSAASRLRWRSSRRSACTVTSMHGSTRSGPSHPATRRSSRSG